MKKQQKTETPQNTTNTTKTSPFLDKNMISANKIMKNEANFNNLNSTATTCPAMVYGDFSPKNQNGTKPNEANLKPIFETENPSVIRKYYAKNKKMKSKPNSKPNEPIISLNKYLISCCIQ